MHLVDNRCPSWRVRVSISRREPSWSHHAVGYGGLVPAAVTPFAIEVSQDALIELRTKLIQTRWPDAETVDDWSQGIPLRFVAELAEYWRDVYDWPARAARLNRFDHFTTELDTGPLPSGDGEALEIHFIHQRSSRPDATPLLITHGWPGSFVEFDQVIEPLTEPDDPNLPAFHVVAPSLPGFAYSQKPSKPGVGVEVIARMWAQLMERLGYGSYIAQGGDWGSAVTASVGAQDPRCAGIHLTLAMQARPKPPEAEVYSEPEQYALDRIEFYRQWDSGYSTLQRTRPQTVAYGLSDSPVGQLAWIVEKFWYWSDLGTSGDVFTVIERDRILDNVMLYWLNNASASSARLYWESFGSIERREVPVPTGFTVYPREIVPPVRRWLDDLFPKIIYWHEAEAGGHFAALEQPTAFVDDLRRFGAELVG